MASVYATSADLKSPDLNSALPRSFAASALSVGSAAGVARWTSEATASAPSAPSGATDGSIVAASAASAGGASPSSSSSLESSSTIGTLFRNGLFGTASPVPSWVPSSSFAFLDSVGTVGGGASPTPSTTSSSSSESSLSSWMATGFLAASFVDASAPAAAAAPPDITEPPRSIPRIIASAAFCMHALTSACSVLLSGVALTTRSKSSSAGSKRPRFVLACARLWYPLT